MAIKFWTDFEKPTYEDAPLFVTTVGKSRQVPVNYPNGFPTFHILLTVSGEGQLNNRDGTYSLPPDTIIIHKKETPLKYAPMKKPWVTAWVTFGGKNAERLLRFPFGVYRTKNREEIVKRIDEMIALPEPRRQSLGRKLLRELLSLITESLVFPAIAPEAKAKDTAIEKLCRYVEENYMHRITIADLCAVAGCQKTKVNDLFREHFGKSPLDYIIAFRVYMAEEILKSSPDVPVCEVARLCGFSSVSHLDRYFKGKTPSKFRKSFFKRTEG